MAADGKARLIINHTVEPWELEAINALAARERSVACKWILRQLRPQLEAWRREQGGKG